jgi:translation initiation factor 2 beta subunit (eIF-2beta)/eIF-5
LEIIENKDKIKQDLINKEYVPPADSLNNNYKPPPPPPTTTLSPPPTTTTDQPDDYDMKDLIEKFNSARKKTDLLQFDDSSSSSSSSSSDTASLYKKSPSIDEDDDDVTKRLKELLAETDSERSKTSPIKRMDKYSRSVEQIKSPPNMLPQSQQPPSLAELEAKGVYQRSNDLRDISRVQITDRQEEDLKREYLFKFDVLKKSYKDANIPELSIHTDLNTLEKTYDSTVRSVTLDSSVENYKKYLIAAFMVIEYALGTKLDMEGFTKQQIVSMNSYERLLIELGEKSYRPSGSSWPVEFRLLGMIILNTAMFLFGKIIVKKSGSSLMGMLNNINQPSISQKKRKMRGPDISLNDIPDLDDVKSTTEESVLL